jgi:hypothetical protein
VSPAAEEIGSQHKANLSGKSRTQDSAFTAALKRCATQKPCHPRSLRRIVQQKWSLENHRLKFAPRSSLP